MHDGHHHHSWGHRGGDVPKRLRAVLILTAAYMGAEAVGGWLANSLALLADAGHMLSDVAALSLSLCATWFARRPPTATRTYGFYRAEILAALGNGAALLAVAAFIVVEAVRRFSSPEPVQGATMFGVAAGGLAINLFSMWLLHDARHESLNVRGAWLHVMLDALGSLGAIAAGLLAWGLGWDRADSLASVLISILVVYSAWSLLRQSVEVLMEGTPSGIDADEVRNSLLSVAGVQAVHDLHIWTITSGMHSLSAHVATENVEQGRRILLDVQAVLAERFGLEHVTIQVETVLDGEPAACARSATHP
jgi:cobalt-zinc-cadmium efflux system protein